MKKRILCMLSAWLLIGILSACGGQATEGLSAEAITFIAEPASLQAGECTTLRWEVSEGFGVTLDGQEVPRTGQQEACPAESRVYVLAVDMGTHIEQRTVEVAVSGTGGTSGAPAYQAAVWTSTGGPPGGLGYDIRMDPRNPDVMYVTDAWAGAFKSLDGGATWFAINNGITTRVGPSGDAIPVFSLTIDPNNPDTLWAGTQNSSGVFRSDDGGENWRPMNNGILEQGLSIRGITVEPGNSDMVYLAGEISSWEWNGNSLTGVGMDMTRGAVYKTTDGGQNWTRIWYGDNLARYIWIHPENHDLLYVSTGIFDREAANSNPATLDPGGVGILRSRDGGATWEVLDADNGFLPEELYFGSLFMHPENPDILIAAAGNDPYQTALGRPLGAIYLTEDGGDNWSRVLALGNASGVEICASDPNVVYAASIRGVHRSQDGGHTWNEVAGRLWGSEDVLAGFPIDLQCDPRDPLRIFINNYIGGNFLSEDGGETWVVSSQGYTGALLRQVSVAADDPNHVYSASRMGIFTSQDGGDSWHGTANGLGRAPEGIVIAVDPFDSNHLLAVLQDAGPAPLITSDGGQTWHNPQADLWQPGQQGIGMVTRIVFSPGVESLVLATAGARDCFTTPAECQTVTGDGIIRSTDGGETWTLTDLDGAHIFDVEFASQSLVYAVGYPSTIYKSEDAGQTWQVIAQDISQQLPESADPDTPVPIPIALAVDPVDANKLYLGFEKGGLAISLDGGLTWQVKATGMAAEACIYDIEVDHNHPGVVYIASFDSGVAYSTDGGETWTILNNGLFTRTVTDLALAADGSRLYLATNGAGVFRMGGVQP